MQYRSLIPHQFMRHKLLALLCVAFLRLSPAFADPVINELMYHPTSTNLLQQWMEIYNPGTNAIDLSGWTLGGDVSFSFPSNTVLAAGAYLVVAGDRTTFLGLYPTATNVIGGWSGI